MPASHRFVAMIALGRPGHVTLQQTVDAYRARYPKLESMLSPFGEPEAAIQHLSGAAGAFNVNVGDVPVAIIPVINPIPPGTLDAAISTSRLWPEAGRALSGHTAHVIVAALKESRGHTDAINLAGAVMSVASCLCDVVSAIGVYWVTGETVTPAQRFQSYTEQLFGGAAPIEVWVQFIWLDGPPKDGARTIGVITTGLMPFIGREIEFLPAPLHPRVIADRLTGTISYLLSNGPVLRDGDTLGSRDDERISIRLLHAGTRPEIPVIRLVSPQATDPGQQLTN